MSTFEKKLNDLTLSDLEDLVVNKVRESRTIEYKSQMVHNDSLCGAIASYANTYGGDFFIGINEEKGEPLSIEGISIPDLDEMELRLNNILQNGIEPRLAKYDIQFFEVNNNNYVILIRTYRSWSRPHRVQSSRHFYARNSNGKFPMDVYELKNMFLGSTEFSHKYEKFKEERLLHNSNVFKDDSFCMIHYVPLSSFENQYILDMHLLDRLSHYPIASTIADPRINFNGMYSQSKNGESRMQIFRNGIIEHSTNRITSEKKISSKYFEEKVLRNLLNQIENYKEMLIDEPFYVMCSMYAVRNLEIILPDRDWGPDTYSHNEDKLVLPEVLIDIKNLDDSATLPVSLARMIKPMLDALWNAFGLPEAILEIERGQQH